MAAFSDDGFLMLSIISAWLCLLCLWRLSTSAWYCRALSSSKHPRKCKRAFVYSRLRSTSTCVAKLSVLEKAGKVLSLFGAFKILNHIRSIDYDMASLLSADTIQVPHRLANQLQITIFLTSERKGSDKVPHHLCRSSGHSVYGYKLHHCCGCTDDSVDKRRCGRQLKNGELLPCVRCCSYMAPLLFVSWLCLKCRNISHMYIMHTWYLV